MSENSDQFDEIIDNLKQSSSWIRILFMLGFAIILYLIVAPVILILMVAQALFAVITGDSNANLRYLGGALTEYIAQIMAFISYNSEHKPFPFAEFPNLDSADDEEETAETKPASQEAAENKPAKKTAKKVAKKTAKKKVATQKASSKKSTDKVSKVADEKSGSDKPETDL